MSRHFRKITMISLISILLISLLNFKTSNIIIAGSCDEITEENADNCIRLNQIQVLGTHNSYKLMPAPELLEVLSAANSNRAAGIKYEHRPLTEQLEELNIRQLELDIFADPDGGLFAEPFGALLSDDEQFIRPAEMVEPGFKVLHAQDIDYRTSCFTLKSCLSEVRDWSLDNPNHLPIMILIEVKDGTPRNLDQVNFTEPVKIDQSNIFEIDDEIWEIFSREHIITPDDVRGKFSTLEEAILESGWPTLAQSRGRILFGLDNTGDHREAYLSTSPILENRALFVSSPPGEPTAAFIKMNDAMRTKELISERVKAGYLVRTRSDIPAQEAISGDTTRRDRALNSGAQYVSTDYPELSPFGSGYIVELPGAKSAGRCNPVSGPDSCKNSFITE